MVSTRRPSQALHRQLQAAAHRSARPAARCRRRRRRARSPGACRSDRRSPRAGSRPGAVAALDAARHERRAVDDDRRRDVRRCSCELRSDGAARRYDRSAMQLPCEAPSCDDSSAAIRATGKHPSPGAASPPRCGTASACGCSSPEGVACCAAARIVGLRESRDVAGPDTCSAAAADRARNGLSATLRQARAARRAAHAAVTAGASAATP